MRIELLASDVDELRRQDVDFEEAFRRGLEALGSRPTPERPTQVPGTEAGTRELVHLYAEVVAHVRLLHFAFATKASDFERSRSEYYGLEGRLGLLRRDVLPTLRARLRELRADEERLEAELRARGVDPDAIGPKVPPGAAIDPTPRPGEGEEDRRSLPGLPPRRGLIDRLRRRF